MKVIELVEQTKTARIDNSDNGERRYGIEARIRTVNGEISDLNNGYVYALDDNRHLCSFHDLHNLNVTFNRTAEDRTAILAAIEEFEAALNVEDLV